MRVFVWEFVAGGGWFHASPHPPSGSLLREGRAMARAICHDLGQLDEVDVVTTHDARVAPFWNRSTPVASVIEEEESFETLVSSSDQVLLIAPEIEGALLERTVRSEDLGAQLLSPHSNFVQLTSDKTQCCNYLETHGIPVPRGGFAPPERLKQFVRKPNWGAGSTEIALVEEYVPADDLRWEEYIPGEPCSVAVIGRGEREAWICPPCRQFVDPARGFAYRGGSRLMESGKAERVRSLARRVIDALPSTHGYFGIDLVLGTDEGGRGDVVIEVNPRLTTSYLGLRQLTENLARHFLPEGDSSSEPPAWASGEVVFATEGEL